MAKLSPISKAFIALVALAGVAVVANALLHWQPVELPGFAALLIISLAASRLRVKLPGFTGAMSVNLPFILLAVATMTAAASLIVGCFSALVQCLPRNGKNFNVVRTLFNVSNMALAVGVTQMIYGSAALETLVGSRSMLLAIATVGYMLVNTMPVAIVLRLTEGQNALRTWAGMLQLSFPYYVAGAGIAGVVMTVGAQVGWVAPLAVLPLMLGIFHSYRRYFSDEVAGQPESGAKRPAASVQAAS